MEKKQSLKNEYSFETLLSIVKNGKGNNSNNNEEEKINKEVKINKNVVNFKTIKIDKKYEIVNKKKIFNSVHDNKCPECKGLIRNGEKICKEYISYLFYKYIPNFDFYNILDFNIPYQKYIFLEFNDIFLLNSFIVYYLYYIYNKRYWIFSLSDFVMNYFNEGNTYYNNYIGSNEYLFLKINGHEFYKNIDQHTIFILTQRISNGYPICIVSIGNYRNKMYIDLVKVIKDMGIDSWRVM